MYCVEVFLVIYFDVRLSTTDTLLSSPRSIPHPQTPQLIRSWWTPSSGYEAELSSPRCPLPLSLPPGSWWPLLDGEMRPSFLAILLKLCMIWFCHQPHTLKGVVVTFRKFEK